jgi:hypothetical protein
MMALVGLTVLAIRTILVMAGVIAQTTTKVVRLMVATAAQVTVLMQHTNALHTVVTVPHVWIQAQLT